MRQRRTHYEVLGLGRAATPEEVKQQYRKLAKRYHPDVAGGADAAVAHAAFVRITEAYQTLADPFKRHSYDLELQRQEAPQAPTHRPAGGARGPSAANAPNAGAARRPGPSSAANAGGGAPRSAAQPTHRAARSRPRPDIAQMLFHAQMDFTRGKFQDALAVCQEVVRRDRRCAGAYSLMGDIYRTRGQADDAIRMYTMAIQLNPASRADMEKLDRLARHNPLAGEEHRRPLTPGLRAAAVAGILATAALFILPVVYPGGLIFPDVGLLDQWTDNLLIGMVGSAIILGFLGAILGLVGRLDDEFLFATVRTGGGRVPVGVLVWLVSVLFFPLALVFYLVTAVMQEGASASMLRTLLIVTGCITLFALAVPPAAGQTLLFGGNVLFSCAVLGNLAGGFFREPWS